MREIIFRGKRVDNGKWVEGCYICLNDKKHLIYTGDAAADYDCCYPDGYVIDPKTLGEYTGLTDKNGRKIFEGDIVVGKIGWCGSPELHIKDITFVVEYEKACWKELYSGDYYEFKVIGNIFDNPELAKGE